MRTPSSERFGRGLFGALEPVEKAGTSEGAKRGWKTRKGEMAPVEETPSEGRRRAAEETPAGGRRRAAEEEPRAPRRAAAPRPPTRSVLDNAATVRAANADNGQITNMSMIGGEDNVGNVYLVEFRDGTKAVYKPTYETGLATGTMIGPLRESLDEAIPESARELAAYQLSEAMGMAVVPHVERVNFARSPESRGLRSREIEGMIQTKLKILALEEKKPEHERDEYLMDEMRFEIEGAVELVEQAADDEMMGAGHTMAYVTGEDAEFIDIEDLKRDVLEGHPDLHRIAALDIITGNTDRHLGNLRRGDDGRYYAIDNGLAFPIDSDHDDIRIDYLDKYLQDEDIPEDVRREIAALDEDHLAQVMTKAGFNDEDILGAQSRLAAMQRVSRWPRSERLGTPQAVSSTVRLMRAAETEQSVRMAEEF